MKTDLREIYGAPTRAAAEAAIDVFADKYGAKYEKAVACLTKDREALLAFFDFPAEHWTICARQPVESVFAVHQPCTSPVATPTHVFKLHAAAKTWRRLRENQLPVIALNPNKVSPLTTPFPRTHLPSSVRDAIQKPCSRRRPYRPLRSGMASRSKRRSEQ